MSLNVSCLWLDCIDEKILITEDTPGVEALSEELFFRGVLTNALLRYGPFVGVVGSTLIFALAHGINIVWVLFEII